MPRGPFYYTHKGIVPPMRKKKLSLAIARYPYGGTGGTNLESPDIGDWLVTNVLKLKKNKKIGDIYHERFSDTPITMTRNASVVWAKKLGVDLLLMLDSDMCPDLHYPQEGTKPFLPTSIDFIYDHYEKGPVVVGAPYGGPPPRENVYIFRWRGFESDTPDENNFSLEQYTREEAFHEKGIQEAAALPTGVILWDMRCFDLVDPENRGWFYYEWSDKYASQKASTEDVTATRDISFAGMMKLGYNPVFCNWDAWAGHWKPKCVGKPSLVSPYTISRSVYRAVERNILATSKEELMEITREGIN